MLAEWTALVAALDAALRYERVHRSPPKLSAKQKRQREKEERKAEKAARREKEAKEKANAKTNVVKRPKRTWSFFQKQQTHTLPIRSASEVGQAAGGVTPNNASADDALDADQRSSASTSTSRATSRGSSTWSMLSGDDSFDQSARNLEEAGEVGGGLGDRAANVVGNDDIDDEGILSLARKMVLNGWMDPLERLRPSAPVLMFRGDNGEDESEVEDTEDGVGLAHLGTDGGGGRGGGVDGGDGGDIASNKVAPLTNGDGGGAKTSSADSSASSSSILKSATSVRKDSGQGDSPSNGGGVSEGSDSTSGIGETAATETAAPETAAPETAATKAGTPANAPATVVSPFNVDLTPTPSPQRPLAAVKGNGKGKGNGKPLEYGHVVEELLLQASAKLANKATVGMSLRARAAVLAFEAQRIKNGGNLETAAAAVVVVPAPDGSGGSASSSGNRSDFAVTGATPAQVRLWELVLLPRARRLQLFAAALSSSQYQQWQEQQEGSEEEEHTSIVAEEAASSVVANSAGAGVDAGGAAAAARAAAAAAAARGRVGAGEGGDGSHNRDHRTWLESMLLEAHVPGLEMHFETVWEQQRTSGAQAWEGYTKSQALQVALARKDELLKEQQTTLGMQRLQGLLEDLEDRVLGSSEDEGTLSEQSMHATLEKTEADYQTLSVRLQVLREQHAHNECFRLAKSQTELENRQAEVEVMQRIHAHVSTHLRSGEGGGEGEEAAGCADRTVTGGGSPLQSDFASDCPADWKQLLREYFHTDRAWLMLAELYEQTRNGGTLSTASPRAGRHNASTELTVASLGASAMRTFSAARGLDPAEASVASLVQCWKELGALPPL